MQIQSLGGTTNSGFLVQSNTFDSVALLVIGLNNLLITGNYFNNKTLGNVVSILVAPSIGAGANANAESVTIDSNTLDGSFMGGNGVLISGISQDPGIIGEVHNFTISNNTLKGSGASIDLQSFDPTCLNNASFCPALSTTLNSKILNNTLTSLWTGSSINIQGGASGVVNGVLVQGNTLSNTRAGATDQITSDSHTYNATLIGNFLSSEADRK